MCTGDTIIAVIAIYTIILLFMWQKVWLKNYLGKENYLGNIRSRVAFGSCRKSNTQFSCETCCCGISWQRSMIESMIGRTCENMWHTFSGAVICSPVCYSCWWEAFAVSNQLSLVFLGDCVKWKCFFCEMIYCKACFNLVLST